MVAKLERRIDHAVALYATQSYPEMHLRRNLDISEILEPVLVIF